ncbi:benzoyl-CoA 2,3-epoxidase subunit BoxA [Phaeobacter gallaeciensis]|uniref:Benzoyl-CoA 2,3-epoxidase subunit BoxA n=2 Tax=Roseobacteraceae TaxID=2854170 RepID=A0A366WWK0_9RHOB|nr:MULTISPECIES: benzoyl-CoA 2,3-epoxidase subunit BoxA [Roseobacteraceae]MBT3142020.1 benzoyl-CoA 2,3-epoxidase subunit BoxA [Falsiruegeria litorea]MBT8168634.1 benzoyl-CoA 2,3-epoxidase subunit BoxA [Falsiruegeria litorea]RBW53896.1 benzoyl-CoA 2,3-epoxidase subunit BoxA [Phaeobacter gallaeciensis]
MTKPFKQHLIDPEICIRCYTCEMTCSAGAIEHDDMNVVVDASKCNFCMDCIPVCPTGSIDEWRVVTTPYAVEDQLEWEELPEQVDLANEDTGLEALDDAMEALLAEAHSGAGGKAKAPASASKPTMNLYTLGKPAQARVQGNYRLTDNASDSDVRHIILDLGALPFPVLEGQSVGIIPPGTDAEGNAHLPRLYSVSSPRDGERPNFNNLSLTVKREEQGLCSNYVCDLAPGDTVQVTGPFGATFLLPSDTNAHLLMICTGTGSAPFRGFTMRRQRENPTLKDTLTLVFGARRPEELPYFGPLAKVPDSFMSKHFAFSRQDGETKQYVQDKLREQAEKVGQLLQDPNGHIYICGLKAMEQGVEEALKDIARGIGLNWVDVRDKMREDGRYHVETY